MALSTTKETTNFARLCRLLVDGGTSVLRNVFDSVYPPASLQSDLATHSGLLGILKKKGILKSSQWNLLFPPPPACVSSSNFDITLLVLLLRNVCGLPAPAKGWDDLPPATDTNVQDNIARIKFYRNEVFAHASQASLTDADFTDFWTKCRHALVQLGGNATEIDQLKCTPMDHEAERRIKALEQWCSNEDNSEEIKKLSQSMEGVKEDVNRGVKMIGDKVEEVVQKVGQVDVKLDKVKEEMKEMKDQIEEVKQQGHATASISKAVRHETGLKDTSEQHQDQLLLKVKSLLGNMRENYMKREAFIHPLPWCKDFQLSLETIYTEVRMVSRRKERSQLTEKRCGLYEIFKPHQECENPRVVLLEGKPGLGKTVSCQKVTLDWSNGGTSGFLASFEILLKIKCRELKSADIKEAIADQLLPLDVSQEVKTALFRYIQDNQTRVLLVLDGLDELKEGIDLSPLIEGRRLPGCYVLSTSRDNPESRHKFDTLFQIIGFTEQNAKSFICKYYGKDEEKAKVLLQKIDDSSGQDGAIIRDLISSPLNTCLLCAISDETNGQLPPTTTQLYKEITFCVLTRYYKKKEEEPPVDPMATHKKELAALGRLALKGIENERLHFNEDAFRAESRVTDILEFGFLSKEPSSSRIRPCPSYQFLHKTYQEFFAAYCFYEELLTGNLSCLGSLHHNKFKQVTLFLVGLLSENPEAKDVVASLMATITRSFYQSTASQSDSVICDAFLYICSLFHECVSVELQQAMCDAVVLNFEWTELRLPFCGISESSVAMKILYGVLKTNRPLQKLYLRQNKINDVTPLAQSVKDNYILKELVLSFNPFPNVSALTRALQDNSSLEFLELFGNKLRDGSLVEDLRQQKPELRIRYYPHL